LGWLQTIMLHNNLATYALSEVVYVLFVALRIVEPCVFQSHSWYYWKVLCKEGYTDFVSWHLNLACESFEYFSYFLIKKLKN